MDITNELLITELPRQCIEDCSAPGRADDAVAYWREELNVTVDRVQARRSLAAYGAWEDAELDAKTDDELVEIVLWIACGGFSEYITHCEAMDADPFDGEYHESDSGSDIFTLD